MADASFPAAGKGQAWARAMTRCGCIIVPAIWSSAFSPCRRGYRDGECPGNDVLYRLLITVLNIKLKIGQVRFFRMP
ncbi:hypothetical protein NJLHNGOC_08485 [Novacetimonas cocois]|uniref:Uncharacterized protein n=1 Tax=Novacetimonas cocois TaxID=1747507 RepID=A0A365YUR5_9PROT|nr:hypothetical protein NJLHNGOC_08485 [Novacetimonas cocois]